MQLSEPIDPTEREGQPGTANAGLTSGPQLNLRCPQFSQGASPPKLIYWFSSVTTHRISPSYHLFFFFFFALSSPHYSISSCYFISSLFPCPEPVHEALRNFHSIINAPVSSASSLSLCLCCSVTCYPLRSLFPCSSFRKSTFFRVRRSSWSSVLLSPTTVSRPHAISPFLWDCHP